MTEHRWQTWRAAMAAALYGEGGFYVTAGAPGRNFRTAAHTSSLWAEAMLALATRVDDDLGRPATFTVVDVGAGGGELLAALADVAPDRWRLVGVDLAPRPDALPDRIGWTAELAADIDGLLIANELLDVVPADVVERVDGFARQVEVTDAGEEELGPMVTGRDAQWLAAWWPLAEDGDRAEIGWPRDDLWRALIARLHRGVAIAIDYAAITDRDVAGTLTGYRDGRQVAPVPDGSCDLTAHVLFDSLREPGDELMTQRESLQLLGINGARPSYVDRPAAYLDALTATGHAAELLDPDGLGGFTWLIRTIDVASPLRHAMS